MGFPDFEVDEVARAARRSARVRRPAHATAVELEVPLYHVDALGIVWHGRYYEYLEQARIRLLRERRHVAPLRYGDRIRVAAWFRDTKHRLQVAYEIANLTQDRRAARAHTTLVTTDPSGRLLLRTPAAILARLAPGETSAP